MIKITNELFSNEDITWGVDKSTLRQLYFCYASSTMDYNL